MIDLSEARAIKPGRRKRVAQTAQILMRDPDLSKREIEAHLSRQFGLSNAEVRAVLQDHYGDWEQGYGA